MYQSNILVKYSIHSMIGLIFYISLPSLLQAEFDEEEELMNLYGDEEIISIATGNAQPISRAPAVATVITADDIKEIGARDIDEVLETVPGLHVARSTIGYNPIYTFRGVYSSENPQVLMLVNNIPITNLFRGDRNVVWGGFPVESISRIEVIRGPGSAVYGADAFAGMINIITKQAHEIDGVEFGSRLGSFDTQDYWGLFGKTIGKFKVALSAEYSQTDGQDEDIESDLQTVLDSLTGTNASLVPGSVNLARDNLDIRTDISYGKIKLRAGFQQRSNGELGIGIGDTLDPYGEFESERFNADLTYHNPVFTDTWDVMAQVSYFDTTQEVGEDSFIFPSGTFVPALGRWPVSKWCDR